MAAFTVCKSQFVHMDEYSLTRKAMAIGHLGQPRRTATYSELRRTLFVRETSMPEAVLLMLLDYVASPKLDGDRTRTDSMCCIGFLYS